MSNTGIVVCFRTITGTFIMGIRNNLTQMFTMIRRINTPYSHDLSHRSRSRLEVKGQAMVMLCILGLQLDCLLWELVKT